MVLETLYGLNATKMTMHQRFALLTADYNRRMKRVRIDSMPIKSPLDIEVVDLVDDSDDPDIDDEVQILEEEEELERKRRALVLAQRRAEALARSLAMATRRMPHSAHNSYYRRADYMRYLNTNGRPRYWQRFHGYFNPQRGRFWNRGRGRGGYMRGRGVYRGRGAMRGGGVRGGGVRGGGVNRGRNSSRGFGHIWDRGNARWDWRQRWQQRPQRVRGQNNRGRGRGTTRGTRRVPLLTRQELDAQLDEYMCKTRAALDKQLDEYMSSAAQPDIEVID